MLGGPSVAPVMTYLGQLDYTGLFEPQLFGVKLSFSGSVKYLVVIQDSQSTWREHVEVKVRKVHNLL
jgi:hypothetical protein